MRSVPSGDTPEAVLAAEVARLSREVADLRSTLTARTAGLVLVASDGSRWRVSVSPAGALSTTPA